MASDSLNQVGKALRKTRREAELALKRTTHTYPQIERARDIFDPNVPFEMMFETDDRTTNVILDLFFNKPPPAELLGCCENVIDEFTFRELLQEWGQTEPVPSHTWTTLGNVGTFEDTGYMFPIGHVDTASADLFFDAPFELPIEIHMKFRINSDETDIPVAGVGNSNEFARMEIQQIDTNNAAHVSFRQHWADAPGPDIYESNIEIRADVEPSGFTTVTFNAPLHFTKNLWYEAKTLFTSGIGIQWKVWISGQSEPDYATSTIICPTMSATSFDTLTANPKTGVSGFDVVCEYDYITVTPGCAIPGADGCNSLVTTSWTESGGFTDALTHVGNSASVLFDTSFPTIEHVDTITGTYMAGALGIFPALPITIEYSFSASTMLTANSAYVDVEFQLTPINGGGSRSFLAHMNNGLIGGTWVGKDATNHITAVNTYTGSESASLQFRTDACVGTLVSQGISTAISGLTVDPQGYFAKILFRKKATSTENPSIIAAVSGLSICDPASGTGPTMPSTSGCNEEGEKVYPIECTILIDDQDVTSWIFGDVTLTPDELLHAWRNIDISQFVRTPGKHTIVITSGTGVGRVEARVKIS